MTNGRRYAAAGIAVILVFVLALWHQRAVVQGPLIGNMVALLDLRYSNQVGSTALSPVEPRLVAHAGGAVLGHPYTNSREALDEHYAKGYRVFELDFHWTSDGRLVVVHDWADLSARCGTRTHVFSYDEFVSAKRGDGLHQLTFEELRTWLQAHRDAFVVTDTKDSNPRFLRYLQQSGGNIKPQLIIQIYRLSELQAARELGPTAVWLTVYKYAYPAWALQRMSGIDAFVIPVGLYDKFRSPKLMGRIHFYVHAVPAQSVGEVFRQLPGIYGIYVD